MMTTKSRREMIRETFEEAARMSSKRGWKYRFLAWALEKVAEMSVRDDLERW